MNKYILGIDGMRCGMCELHVEQAIERGLEVKKVKASHLKNNAVVFSECDLNQQTFEAMLNPTGYRITSFEKAVAKKSLFGWR